MRAVRMSPRSPGRNRDLSLSTGRARLRLRTGPARRLTTGRAAERFVELETAGWDFVVIEAKGIQRWVPHFPRARCARSGDFDFKLVPAGCPILAAFFAASVGILQLFPASLFPADVLKKHQQLPEQIARADCQRWFRGPSSGTGVCAGAKSSLLQFFYTRQLEDRDHAGT
jgi:hypothetical protein